MGIVQKLTDGLTNVITGLGTRSDARTARAYAAVILDPAQIENAYEGSAMLRKAIAIPANDRVRAWRDWQADADQIELLEAEEERHQLQAKVKQAEILRGLGGGAIILVTAGDPALPLNVTAKSGLVAANVVSRWHLAGQNWEEDLASPRYGEPEYWTISASGRAAQQRIHPSRVVCFRAEPIPSIWRTGSDDRFWGRGRVPTLLEPAQNLDEALASFAAMIKDARNVDIGIPKLFEMLATPEGEQTLMKRLSLMIEGSSIFRGKVFDTGDAEGKGGEKIDRHQVTWTGIPDIIRVYAEALSAASDIPVTRLWGTPAKGLNATGEGDDRNWNKMVEAGQTLETGPCLRQIDAALIPSALGSRPPEVWWKFAALDVPSDKEETDRFDIWTKAAEKVQLSGTIPEVAFAKAYQNGLSENGWMPGLDGALAEVPEGERFGMSREDDPGDDPSVLQAQQREGGDLSSLPAPGSGEEAPPRRRLQANDKREVGDEADLPFLDAKRRSKGQRLAGNAKASAFNPTQPRGRDGRWIPAGRRKFIDEARSGRFAAHQLEVGRVSSKTAERMSSIGLNGAGKGVSLDASAVRHTHKRHGNESRSGQRKVEGGDFASAASILNSARSMRRVSPARTGAPRFATMTRSKGQRVFAIFEVRKRSVTLHTMWVRG